MKRNYILKNKGRIALVVGLLATTLLSSCLKDTSPGSLDLSKSPALVGFQYYGFGETPITTKLHAEATDNTDVKLTLSVASITLGSAVTVNIVDDPTDAKAYADANTAAGTPTSVLPASDYTITASQVTIPAGQQYATFKINFKGNVIDFSQNWVLGVKITSASGAIVASNLNVAILALTLQSLYEGDYNDNGYTLRAGDNVLGGYFKGYDEQMNTISAFSVGYTILWATDVPAGGVAGTFFTVDPATNKVTIGCSTNATLANAAGYDSRYDPATKTFYVSMTWSTPGTRGTTDTLTYKGPL
jgi:hypothetical protein